MKIGKFTFISFLAVILSCSHEVAESRATAVRLNIELGSYWSADGRENKPKWNSDEKVGIFNLSSGETMVASPILGGSSSSMFLFNSETVETGTELIACYPANACSYVADGYCSTNIPVLQTGTALPYQIGSVSYKDNVTMYLKPFGCLFVAHISKGDYSVEKVVLKSNSGEKISGKAEISLKDMSCRATEGEIAVVLETPLECSGSDQYVTFITAPVSLSSGYTIEFITTSGKSFTFGTSKRVDLISGKSVHSDNYLNLLCLGNSFTGQQNPVEMLEQLSSSQGYCLKINKFTKDGYTFADHLENAESKVLVEKGGYNYAFIQDQSQAAANYMSDKEKYSYVCDDTQRLTDNILKYAPDCQLILELTWAYPGKKGDWGGFSSSENFDSLLRQGTLDIAQKVGTWVSPIGPGFSVARTKYPEITMYNTDYKHQSVYGAYLKACINYLVLTGKKFNGVPADCGLDAGKAEAMRKCAEETLLGKEREYLILR